MFFSKLEFRSTIEVNNVTIKSSLNLMSSFYPSSLPPPHQKKKLSANAAWICATAKAAFLAYCCTFKAQKAQLVHFWVMTCLTQKQGLKGRLHVVSTGICESLQNRAAQMEGNNMSLCRLFASVQSNSYSSELSMEKKSVYVWPERVKRLVERMESSQL